MDRDQLFFDLPPEQIAQTPVTPRDHCRLMLVDRVSGAIEHKQFFDIVDQLQAGDVLVFNQSKVLPARLYGHKTTGGRIEIVLLKDLGAGAWQCLVGGKIAPKQIISFARDLEGHLLPPGATTQPRVIQFTKQGSELVEIIATIGQMPIPPYVKSVLTDPSLYQTVYAKEFGSAAAPTAGLHFTEPLLKKIRAKGVRTIFVTLHVGLGTFQPVQSQNVEDHHMHSEWFHIETGDWQVIEQAKQQGNRVIAVGTTSVRVLETIADPNRAKQLTHNELGITGETNIFILPGYNFRIIDGLITNFHTPYSTLLALVYAFGGRSHLQNAYKIAIQESYRFFSFGDAMFIR